LNFLSNEESSNRWTSEFLWTKSNDYEFRPLPRGVIR